jgi:hypothetical protein
MSDLNNLETQLKTLITQNKNLIAQIEELTIAETDTTELNNELDANIVRSFEILKQIETIFKNQSKNISGGGDENLAKPSVVIAKANLANNCIFRLVEYIFTYK